VTFFPAASGGQIPTSIVVGPDANLWFVESSGGTGGTDYVSRLTTGGQLAQFAVPNGWLQAVTSGPDGNLWFTQWTDRIGRMTPSGAITTFVNGISPGAEPQAITTGPDANLWFAEYTGNRIGRITPAGVVSEFVIPTPSARPFAIMAAPDGNLWFTEEEGNRLGRVTPAGVITEFDTGIHDGGTARTHPQSIAVGSDGNLWFTFYVQDGNGFSAVILGWGIARMSLPATPVDVPALSPWMLLLLGMLLLPTAAWAGRALR
jgi:streptogramin lyase